MKPQWGSMREPDLDPEIEAAARRVLDSVDDLRTVRMRVENLDVAAVLNEPTLVTEGLMFEFASLPTASPALRDFALRVRAGECRWPEIESLVSPPPPEVVDLKSSARFIWPWGLPENLPPPVVPPSIPPPPTSRPAETGVVGPSDWPDDFDDYPDDRSWLV